ncbi:unnamed protein product [Bursaphelenchus xylophilus]|uniref:(pine wood nematode) hypothetical protein n=1 Tax=Bursaphelenchus xylophilus TaxID=6326 RepID=A0A1I7RRA8_BURXY|nr:unnamed protein product [Bursaphelenchus xylophilus]CAG9130904.1 unnamed protein product [Bursaphelenchus xylophilus]
MFLFTELATPTQTSNPRSSSQRHSFNPNAPRYRLCCCRVKTFTITFCIIEIFFICFMLIAILPDLSSRACNLGTEEALGKMMDNYTINFTIDNITINSLFDMEALQVIGCKINGLWFAWALLQLISINLAFYGCKNIKWKFVLPHLIFRLMCTLLLVFLLTLLIVSVVSYEDDSSLNGFLMMVTVLGLFWVTALIAVQIRCIEFLKKSAESGYSVTITRTFGPPTISLSDRAQLENAIVNREAKPPEYNPNLNAISEEEVTPVNEEVSVPSRKLPPLRHTYRP